MPVFKAEIMIWTEQRINTGPETRWYEDENTLTLRRFFKATNIHDALRQAEKVIKGLSAPYEAILRERRKASQGRSVPERVNNDLKLEVLRDRTGRFLPTPPTPRPRVKKSRRKA